MNKTAKAVLLALLRAYKYAVSPLFPPSCRYVPTCSEYAAEAVERHGVLRGSAMAVWRVLRCHPFVRGGYDAVPLNHMAPGVHARAGRGRIWIWRAWTSARRTTAERIAMESCSQPHQH